MDESERNRLRNRQEALLLAASDMDHAAAAARALQTEADGALARALETAIATAYMRPFTGRRPRRLPDAYVPTGEPDAGYHSDLKEVRNKVYAHSDKANGRYTSLKAATREGGIVTVEWQEQWLPIPLETLPALIDLCERQAERFRHDAASLHVQLHGLGSLRA
jgi:hypothetical protein